jgi:MFS family permease
MVLHIPKIKREHAIDYLGALLLIAAVVPILLTLSVYGPENGWSDSRTIAYLVVGVIFGVLFFLQEKRAKEPILPLHLFENHTFNLTSLLGAVIGAGMFGAIVMLPLYMQVVKGYSASSAGLKLIPMMLGIVSMSIYSGKTISKHGHYKRFPIIGALIMTFGILMMTRLEIDTPYWQVAINAVLIGMGLGLSMQTIVIALQNSVEMRDMGVATSSNTFFRSLGSVFGTAFFGSVLTNRLAHYMQSGFADLAKNNPAAAGAIDPSKMKSLANNSTLIHQLPADIQHVVLQAFVNSFHVVFYVAAPITALGFFLALMLKEVPLRTNADYQKAKEDAAGETLG